MPSRSRQRSQRSSSGVSAHNRRREPYWTSSPHRVSGREAWARCHNVLSMGLTASGPTSSPTRAKVSGGQQALIGTIVPSEGRGLRADACALGPAVGPGATRPAAAPAPHRARTESLPRGRRGLRTRSGHRWAAWGGGYDGVGTPTPPRHRAPQLPVFDPASVSLAAALVSGKNGSPRRRGELPRPAWFAVSGVGIAAGPVERMIGASPLPPGNVSRRSSRRRVECHA
jgi:hypothetical protein